MTTTPSSSVKKQFAYDKILQQIFRIEYDNGNDCSTGDGHVGSAPRQRAPATEDPMFVRLAPHFSYNYYNCQQHKVVWDLRSDLTFGLALSVYGTSHCVKIQQKFACFKGFSPGNLAGRTYNWMRYHSTDQFRGSHYDMFRIRQYFQDEEQALADGFVVCKGSQFRHSSMTFQELKVWFLRFELSSDQRRRYKQVLRRINYQPDVPLKFKGADTVTILKYLTELEQKLHRKLLRTIEME